MFAAAKNFSAPVLQVRNGLHPVGLDCREIRQAWSKLRPKASLEQLAQSSAAAPTVISSTIGNLVGLPDEIMKLKLALKKAPGTISVDTSLLAQASDVNALNSA